MPDFVQRLALSFGLRGCVPLVGTCDLGSCDVPGGRQIASHDLSVLVASGGRFVKSHSQG